MKTRRFGKTMVWARRAAQVACLALFFYLFWLARFDDESEPSWLLSLFFDVDPLILIATWLAARAVPAAAFLALVTMAVTLVFGRVFCGWVCPLGTIHHFAGWLGQVLRRGKNKAQGYSRWQNAKYYLLVALLVMAALGGHWIGVFDPISQLYRVTATVLLPAKQYAVEAGSTAVYHADPHLGPLHVTEVTEPVYNFTRDHIFVTDRQSFDGSTSIAFFFIATVLLNLYRKRFWCRYVCPLGGLLGLLSKRLALRVQNNPEQCQKCGQCAKACPAGAAPDIPAQSRPTECFSCWNCQSACKFDAVALRFASPMANPTQAKIDLGKRATLCAGGGGIVALLTFRLTPQSQGKTYNPTLIRPPGAHAEKDFLARCLQCGMCMKVCPTNGLHPTGLDAGLEGLWTPKLIPKIGYCEFECNLCGQVCPTEAIAPLSLEDKQQVKIGLATLDTTRCLPWAYERECSVCEEHCPLPKKAIYLTAVEVTRRDGSKITVQQPRVDENLCTGCGICEAKCVFRDLPAIRVTSANESRNPDNEPFIQSFGGHSGSESQDYPGDSAEPNPYGGSDSSSSNDPYR